MERCNIYSLCKFLSSQLFPILFQKFMTFFLLNQLLHPSFLLCVLLHGQSVSIKDKNWSYFIHFYNCCILFLMNPTSLLYPISPPMKNVFRKVFRIKNHAFRLTYNCEKRKLGLKFYLQKIHLPQYRLLDGAINKSLFQLLSQNNFGV